jgi:hypothetical protein
LTSQSHLGQRLGISRMLFYGLCLVNMLYFPVTQFSKLPKDWFKQLGLASFFGDSFWNFVLTDSSLTVIQYAGVTLGFLAILGLRPWGLISGLFALFFSLWLFIIMGFNSYINHAQLGMFYAVILLPFFPCADFFSIRGDRRQTRDLYDVAYEAPFQLIPALLSVCYMFIGVRRLMNGGLEIFI